MPKGLAQHTGDPNIKMGSTSPVPNGDYAVNGISRFISVDPQGNPIFVEQNGKLVVKFEFRRADGGQGMACSATPAEFWAIVAAMGIDVNPLVVLGKTNASALNKALSEVNKSTKSINVKVKNGWVNGDRITDAVPPAGNYVVRLAKVHRTDYVPGYDFVQRIGGNGPYEALVFEFEILRSAFGKPTAYDGYMIPVFFYNPFCDAYTDAHGKFIQAVEKGIPLYAKDAKNGGDISAAKNWDIFAQYFAPQMVEREWQVDPSKSEYNVCEVLQPQYVYIGEALKAKREVIVYYKDRPRAAGRTIDMRDVPSFNELPGHETIQVENTAPSSLHDLIVYIESRWPEVKVFDQSGSTDNKVVFTPQGIDWAKATFGGENGPWQRSGLPLGPNKPAINDLTDEQVIKLLTEMKAQYGELGNEGW